ncbi:tail fiber protein [Enterobacter soli]|uniref:tail fiber protein n=3 Tax=Enterobacter soli TaxID=885040 RepID=UPI00325AE12A
MSQTAITLAFEQWKANQAVTGEPVLLDEFVFANVPGLNTDKAIDRNEGLPPAAQIVHRQAVSRKGVVNENAVVHSVVLGADVGDFSFNWVGLINKASNTLAMIVHAPLQQKLKTKDGQQGNVLTRSFLMEYKGAQTETGINTPAETWQIDFTARMAGMDERQRQENIDLYGAAAFLGDGWLVAKSGTQFYVTAGAGYVRGLRALLAANQNITVTTKPVKVWLDVAWTGTLTSAWAVSTKITVAASLADYVQNGVQHYVFAVASIDANGNITDLRPKGTLNDQTASDALAKHELSRNHPDATTAAKGFTQLSSATDSDSEVLAATPKAVKAAYDLAKGKYTAQDATTAQKGIVQLSSATDSTSEVLAATPKAVKSAYDLAKGKYTAQDATTAQKGIVQLSSATDSTSEVLAATPKAVKAANDNANTRFPTAGGWLTGNSGVKTTLGSITFGVGNTDVYIQNGTSNKYLQLGNNGELKYSGSYIYHEGHKPTASEVDAVSAENGGTFKKEVAFSGGLNIRSGTTGIYPGSDAAGFTSANMIFKSWYGIGFYCTLPDSAGDETGMTGYINTRNGLLQMKGQIIPGDYANFDGRFIKLAGNLNITGTLRSSAEFQSTSQNNYRIVSGNFGTFWRQDGSRLYLMLTNSGDQYGGYNSLRPFYVDLATGNPVMSQLALTDYTSFDARYYTKTLAESTFQPKGSYGKPNTYGISGNVMWWKCGDTGVIRISGVTANVSNSGRVAFPLTFPNKCFSVVANRNHESGDSAAMQPYSIDATGFNLRIAGGGTATITWIAEGR